MLEDIVCIGLDELGIPYDGIAVNRLRVYSDYLEEINKVMNLTAIEGEDNIARLHFLDCAAILCSEDFNGKSVIDVGSGAGFPGMVLKILAPDIKLTLLDSLDKRIRFLDDTCSKLGISDVNCLHARAEEAPAEMRASYDIATARAVAGLNILAELCLPFVKKGGCFIAMKGPDCTAEIKASEKAVAILGGKIEKVADYVIPGTDIHHTAVVIRKISGTPKQYPRRWAQIKKTPL